MFAQSSMPQILAVASQHELRLCCGQLQGPVHHQPMQFVRCDVFNGMFLLSLNIIH